MTSNGGPCLLRQGFWSQTVVDAKVYFPIKNIIPEYCQFNEASIRTDDLSRSKSNNEIKLKNSNKKWNVIFSKCEIQISHEDYGVVIDEILEYNIRSGECLWTLESIGTNDQHSHCIVLYLIKEDSAEIFPGCEWWDRVFRSDEAIDTTTCSIGSSLEYLPNHARIFAEKENARFQSLSQSQQDLELNNLMKIKREFAVSVEKTKQQAIDENNAIESVPERAVFLESLREEFPHIQFTAK
jgi:hypothetical protein